MHPGGMGCSDGAGATSGGKAARHRIAHSGSRTDRNIYGHLFPDSRQKVAAKLDAYLDAGAASV